MQRRSRRVLPAEVEFTNLRDALRRNHDGFYDMGIKVNAALAVALGWFAVQEHPLPQLCSKYLPYSLKATAVVLMLCWLAVVVVFVQRYLSSCVIAAALDALKVPTAVFASDLISKRILAVGIGFQFVIFTCLGMSIYTVYPDGSESFQCRLAEAEKEARMAVATKKVKNGGGDDDRPEAQRSRFNNFD